MIAPTGNTSASPAAAALSRISATMPAWSVTGSVLAIDETAVNPPAAAARVPGRDRLLVLEARLAQVRVQVDEPGREHEPAHVEHLGALRSRPGPTASIATVGDEHVGDVVATRRRIDHPRPAEQHRLRHRATSPSPVGAARRPAEQQVQQRHADRDAVRHLLLDHAPAAGRRRRSRSRRRGSSAPGA